MPSIEPDRLVLDINVVVARAAPGPVVGPAGATAGAHYRDPEDWARCVCGVSWVQAMTCHPCRLGPHPASACVDGPPTVQVPHRDGTPRFVYAERSAGRWCSCQHVDPATGAAYIPPREVTGGRGLTVGDGPGLVTRDDPAGARFGHPGYMAERPAPFLAPALEAAGITSSGEGFYRGLQASDIAADVVERAMRRALEHYGMRMRGGRRPRAERLASAQARGEGPRGVQLGAGMPPAEPVVSIPAVNIAVGPDPGAVDEAAAARAARLIGACGGAMT